ncbi:transcriptional regulator [Romboutsia maritimum]|uniref:Transcriptional regulator n=1 Tax=Romboutsia maritimum TaxID=2020948 RepID=A0A371IRC7_9FIRM|nr:metal-sensitive transcriptional regulator [Romboutsia maritimum]RDY23030.1 transcriptional regulator [Romboutsia maritimum]
MEEKKLSKSNDKDALNRRLKRIEGQVKGIQKMIDEDRYCVDILVQVSAIRSAINKVGSIILENHIKGCVSESLKHDDEQTSQEMIAELMDTVNKFTK